MGKYNVNRSESNDDIAFTVLTDEIQQKKSDKKKEVTCFSCKKVEHYYNECEDELHRMTGGKKIALIRNQYKIITLKLRMKR